ncbi:MAG: serine O-acetyltransferase [Bacteroidales bacterium]|nr:serine O-acetyltransferase [Bacteroidales bacterium]
MTYKNRALAGRLSQYNSEYCADVPSMVLSRQFTENLVHALFPIRQSCAVDEGAIAIELERSAVKLRELLDSISKSLDRTPAELVDDFFSRVPEAFEQLAADAVAVTRFDPAASCVEEIILCYPGFFAITVYRMAHILYDLNVPVLPRIMAEYAHEKTGIDIHPGAQIASPFFIDHGTGIVIGETARIGREVRIYQGVTLGALTVERSMANTKRHPTIEDHVVIYAGSTILGGDTVIGHHTVVGGNTWITESILPHSVVYRNHRVVVKDRKDFKPPNDFEI